MLRNERFSRGDGRTGAIFVLSPFGLLARLAVIDRMILEGKENARYKCCTAALGGGAAVNQHGKGREVKAGNHKH